MYNTQMQESSTEILLTKEEYVTLMINYQDIALNLLSKQRKLSQKVIHDQAKFVEKLTELLKENDSDFPLEHVHRLLPQNNWYLLYFDTIPQLEMFVRDDPTSGVYNA